MIIYCYLLLCTATNKRHIYFNLWDKDERQTGRFNTSSDIITTHNEQIIHPIRREFPHRKTSRVSTQTGFHPLNIFNRQPEEHNTPSAAAFYSSGRWEIRLAVLSDPKKMVLNEELNHLNFKSLIPAHPQVWNSSLRGWHWLESGESVNSLFQFSDLWRIY